MCKEVCYFNIWQPTTFSFAPEGKPGDLIPYLDALQFRNGPSFVHSNQSFNWQQFCGLYFEPENVSTIRFGWDVLELRSYLFQNPTKPGKQRSPPMGMRSAVPLGGLGKVLLSILRLFKDLLDLRQCTYLELIEIFSRLCYVRLHVPALKECKCTFFHYRTLARVLSFRDFA